jgi:hypothetical protein
MFSYVRKHASPVNVIAVIALVLAMTGGALAATKVIITSTKQIKPSVLAQLKGKNGAPGAQGPQGPAGPAGTPGAKGENGANGTNGSNGADGKAGAAGPKGTTGTNGTNGVTGATGPTVFILPSGKTETGTWSVTAKSVPATEETWTAIAFPIPVEKPSASAFFITALETEEIEEGAIPFGKGECAGTLKFPTAPKGELCVYTEEEELKSATLLGIKGHEVPGYEPAGAFIDFQVTVGGTAKVHGNWAVTAP